MHGGRFNLAVLQNSEKLTPNKNIHKKLFVGFWMGWYSGNRWSFIGYVFCWGERTKMKIFVCVWDRNHEWMSLPFLNWFIFFFLFAIYVCLCVCNGGNWGWDIPLKFHLSHDCFCACFHSIKNKIQYSISIVNT